MPTGVLPPIGDVPSGGTAVMVTGGNGAGVELYVTTANGLWAIK